MLQVRARSATARLGRGFKRVKDKRYRDVEFIFKLLGGSQDRVKAYVPMLGLKPTEEQVRQAKYYFGQGFRAINLRTHRPHVEEDLEVIQAVRAAVGSEMEIMVDANQAWNTDSPFWNVQTALRVARELEKLNVAWLKSMVQGYFNYHAVPGNTDSLGIFRHRVTRLWR